jgi:protein-tyrosine-phosphatase
MALIVGPRIATAQNQSPARSKTEPRRQIVFVCEHGAALSVVAAAYFNRLAKQQHLNLHAVARGTAPQQDIASSAEKGLREDGVPSETKRPQALSTIDGVRALRIVAFCPIPEEYSKIATVETWNDVPPTSVDYAAARDAILKHLKELMSELSQTEKTQ